MSTVSPTPDSQIFDVFVIGGGVNGCGIARDAAGVPAIETVYPDFSDSEGLAAYAGRARRDGFTGMMAIHPRQISIIAKAFEPSQSEIDHARAVLAAFEGAPGAGAIQLDGRMIDRPHLKAAQRLLEQV